MEQQVQVLFNHYYQCDVDKQHKTWSISPNYDKMNEIEVFVSITFALHQALIIIVWRMIRPWLPPAFGMPINRKLIVEITTTRLELIVSVISIQSFTAPSNHSRGILSAETSIGFLSKMSCTAVRTFNGRLKETIELMSGFNNVIRKSLKTPHNRNCI